MVGGLFIATGVARRVSVYLFVTHGRPETCGTIAQIYSIHIKSYGRHRQTDRQTS